jgi:hypothetical protein
LAAQSLFGAGIAAAAHQHNGTVVTRGTQQDAAGAVVRAVHSRTIARAKLPQTNGKQMARGFRTRRQPLTGGTACAILPCVTFVRRCFRRAPLCRCLRRSRALRSCARRFVCLCAPLDVAALAASSSSLPRLELTSCISYRPCSRDERPREPAAAAVVVAAVVHRQLRSVL